MLGSRRAAGLADEVVSFEGCPGTLMDAVTDFLVAERQRLRGETLHREAAMEAGLPLLPPLHHQGAPGAGTCGVHHCACSVVLSGQALVSSGHLDVLGGVRGE